MLQVKNLPDNLHAALAARSKAQGVTMSEYVTRLLRRDLARPALEEWLEAHGTVGERRPIDVVGALDAVRVEYEPAGTRAHSSEDAGRTEGGLRNAEAGRRRDSEVAEASVRDAEVREALTSRRHSETRLP